MFQKKGGAMFRILVVSEDDHAIRTLVQQVKTRKLYIYTAENREEALSVMESIRWIY